MQVPMSQQKRVIAYIDGFNLYFGMRSKGWKRYYWLDVYRMSQALLDSSQTLVGVKYFSARISYPRLKQERQNTYLEALESLGTCTLHFGQYLNGKRECQSCHRVNHVPSEKMTDVNIAVEMMTDAFNDEFDTALLISADSDLTPPILKVTQIFPNKDVVVAFPPERSSKRLEQVSSAQLRIFRRTLANSQMPDMIVKPNGFTLCRPSNWN